MTDPTQDAGTLPETEAADQPAATPEQPAPEPRRFGTFQGVFIPSILTILGVIMYLRLGWVVGHAGIVLTVVIVTLACAITFITALSIAATATNMRVRGGGAYFMISRSFGVESGAAIGLPLYLAQATGVSFYLAGFSESMAPLLPGIPPHLIGLTALVVLTLLAFVSANLALKSQLLIFAIIIASLISLVAGPFSGQALGQAATDAAAGAGAAAGSRVPFWVIFAVFFPAVTGIEAGISMSGDLKEPRRALPIGTITAVLTGYAVYILLPILLWFYVPRPVLRANPMIMWDMALLPQAIYAGIWGATLSSAMGALLGGSRTLQALATDRVVPRFVGQGHGPSNEPRLATLVTFAIAAGGLYAGSLDVLAPVLSMFFLTSYGALNTIAALEGLIGNPSWRPTFRTPWRLSVLGAVLCLGTMLMIDSGASIVAITACSGVYLIMRRRRLHAGWSDIRGGVLQALARYSIYRLGRYQDVARVWRPNILLFSGAPTSRWYLVALADAITHGKGFLTVATIIERKENDETKVRSMEHAIEDYLKKHHVPALVRVKYAPDFVAGIEGLATDYGLGHIEPNTIMMGDTEDKEHLVSYCRLLCSLHRQHKNAILVRDARGTEQAEPSDDKPKVIDVWMRSRGNNSTLMLLFAFMLQSSPEWQGAKLTIKGLAANEDARRGQIESLEAFLAESRIEADIEVIVQRPDREPLQEISRYSADADLVFMGLRAPEDDESPEDYAAYYGEMLNATRTLPLTIITLAGEKIEFREVFA